jgi:hypothetical protein
MKVTIIEQQLLADKTHSCYKSINARPENIIKVRAFLIVPYWYTHHCSLLSAPHGPLIQAEEWVRGRGWGEGFAWG